jgi:hypothetical protein
VGVYWIGLDRPGFGIHGTPQPATIGSMESHGCFRLTNRDILTLSRHVRTGTPVTVRGARAPAPAAATPPAPPAAPAPAAPAKEAHAGSL